MVDFAYQNAVQQTLQKAMSLDALRRAAYENDLHPLFEGKWPTSADTREKLLTPDMTIRQVIDKFGMNIFMHGSTFSAIDDRVQEILSEIISTANLDEKLFNITKETSLMGYVGLRSVWYPEINNWVIEIKPKEQLLIETDTLNKEIVTAISVQYQFWDTDQKLKWYKERWTTQEYTLWTPLEAGGLKQNQAPDFSKQSFTTVPNTFCEIPITLVYHKYNPECLGDGVVRHDDILVAKKLIRLKNKRHYAHLEHMDPTLVVLNGNDDDVVERGVGAVIRVSANSGELPPSVNLIEAKGVPDSVKKEIMDDVKDFYKNAGLTPPTDDEVFKAGTASSAVALRVKDEDEAKTMESLRGGGYSLIAKHLEKLLRMGARTRKLPAYTSSGINPDDRLTYQVSVKFPPFFPPTPEEQQVVLQTLKQSHLSSQEKARREAQIFNVEDPDEIEEIQSNIEAEALLKSFAPTANQTITSSLAANLPIDSPGG